MNTVINNSKARVKALVSFILENVTGHRTSFEVSDPKGDGTVFVRFRSSPYVSSIFLAETFRDVLAQHGHMFEQTDDVKFRVSIEQFCT